MLEDTRFDPGPVIHVRARSFMLDGGFRLLVGRGIEDLLVARNRVIWTLGWGLAIMVILGVLGSILMSRGMLRRIDQITATSEKIVSGDLGRRVPTRGTGDDFDRLSEQLNRMLDQIESLLESVRRISDNIAHDLKTPLTRLRNRLETINRRQSRARPGPRSRHPRGGRTALHVQCAPAHSPHRNRFAQGRLHQPGPRRGAGRRGRTLRTPGRGEGPGSWPWTTPPRPRSSAIATWSSGRSPTCSTTR
ncbi:MAG: HAMP domain-containing protein [Gammaproteobacteria bacterium]|nr:HAMP domain-containing protein [Gammaproteobacteria bacterium]